MKKKYWYKFIIEYCPICGQESSWKERIYNKPKPKYREDRHIWKSIWDYCDI